VTRAVSFGPLLLEALQTESCCFLRFGSLGKIHWDLTFPVQQEGRDTEASSSGKETSRSLPQLLWPRPALIITVVFYHPPNVTLCPTHLLLFSLFLGPFHPALHLRAVAKRIAMSLVDDAIPRGGSAASRGFTWLKCRAHRCKLMECLVPPLLRPMRSNLLPSFTLQVFLMCEGKSALCSKLPLLLCLRAHFHLG